MSELTAMMKQLEELHILNCSLLPGEVLTFVLDAETWTHMLETYPNVPPFPGQSQLQACFEVKLDSSNLWFEVKLPHSYPDGDLPLISVKGTDLTRGEQEKWKVIVRERSQELEGSQ
jgi:hypothetical protein